MKLTKQQQQIIVFAVLFLGGGGFLYIKGFWIPMSARIREATEQIKVMDEKISKAKGQAARLDKVKQELEALNQQAADAETRLPKIKDVPAVIDTLSRVARKYRIEISNFAPGNSSQKQYFVEVPYTLGISGTYHDIGRFFAAIALEDRIFSVRNVSFSGPVGTGNKLGMISATFILVSYQYRG